MNARFRNNFFSYRTIAAVVVVMLALIVFHLVLGWKVYSLSRAPLGVLKIGERAGALKTMQEGRVNAPASVEGT